MGWSSLSVYMRENLLAQLGNFDLFWCGPKDEWYERTAAFLHGIPEYRREIAYETVRGNLLPTRRRARMDT